MCLRSEFNYDVLSEGLSPRVNRVINRLSPVIASLNRPSCLRPCTLCRCSSRSNSVVFVNTPLADFLPALGKNSTIFCARRVYNKAMEPITRAKGLDWIESCDVFCRLFLKRIYRIRVEFEAVPHTLSFNNIPRYTRMFVNFHGINIFLS